MESVTKRNSYSVPEKTIRLVDVLIYEASIEHPLRAARCWARSRT